MHPPALFFVITFISTRAPISAILIDTCNCTLPTFKGTIDLSDPDYCTHPGPVRNPVHVNYAIITKNKDPITWTGYACTQWLSQKEISTNFLLSHDTTYTKQVLKVSSTDCWKSAQYPQMCDTNPMTKDGETLKSLQEPDGKGQWMTTQTFVAKNCVTQAIKLAKECHDCPVTSPFGIIANSSNDEFANHNDLTIVWHRPDATQEPECAYKTILSSHGNLTRGFSQSKLEDYSAQLELIFHNNVTTLCTNGTFFTVTGVPDTYIKFTQPIARGKRSMNDIPTGIIRLANTTKYCLSYPKLDIAINVNILLCATEENIETSDEYLSSVERGQNFQFLESGLIFLTEETYCIHSWDDNQIAANSCNGGRSDTGYDTDTWMITDDPSHHDLTPIKIILTDRNLCLSATANETTPGRVFLANCSDSSDQFFHF